MDAATRNRIFNHILQGELGQALDLLSNIYKEKNNQKFKNVLLLRARLHEIENQYKIQSIINAGEYEQARNKIIIGIQELLNEPTSSYTHPIKEVWNKRYTPILMIIGLVIIVVLILNSGLQKNNPPPVGQLPATESPTGQTEDQDEKEAAAWQKAQSAHTTKAYQRYLDTYPHGQYAVMAEQKIAALATEKELWQKVVQDNTVEGYREYLSQFADGRYSQQAKEKIDELDRNAISAALSIMPITDLKANSSRSYELQSLLKEGSKMYTDRKYICQNIPSNLQGAFYIASPNEDKWIRENNAMLSFTANRKIRVYVAYDERYGQVPKWLNAYVKSEQKITAYYNDGNTGNYDFNLYHLIADKGHTIEMGGNYALTEDYNGGMYFVILEAI